MVGTDFSHLTNDELIKGIKALDLPDYIRSKAYGIDVRETLAQMTEMTIQLGVNMGLSPDEALDLARKLQNIDARIDNLVANAGDVASNGELLDIRVGVDGTTYANAGDAVRTQIDKVNTGITKMSEIQVEWNENYYISPSNGVSVYYAETEELKYWASDYIDITNATALYGYVINNVQGVFYDKTGQYMSTASATNGKRDYIDVPIGAKYFRFSKETKSKKDVDYSLLGFINFNDVQNTITSVDGLVEDYDLSQISMGAGYLIKNGNVINDPTGYSTTDFIPINPFFKIRVLCTIIGTVCLGVFDENKNIIQFIDKSDVIEPSLIPQVVEINLDKNAHYIRFTGHNTYSQNISDYYVKAYVSKHGIDMITNALSDEVDNIATPNNKVFASLSMFNNFAVIGDSYASGEIIVNGSAKDYYDLSWGQNIARNCGNTCLNLSRGGLTTQTWLTADKGLTLMKSSNPQGLYMISLGLNDQGRISRGEYELGSINDLNADYNLNPDTFYGNYGKIIGNIKDHAPDAKIIISTVTQGRDGDFPIPNGAIREIANHFSLPLINLGDDYFFRDPFFRNNLVGSHMTATGYSGYALGIMRLFSKCIEEYDSYFADYVG